MEGKALAVVRAIQMKCSLEGAVRAGDPQSASLVDDAAVQHLVGMGFTEKSARNALQFSGGSIKQGMEWLLQHGGDGGEVDALSPQPTQNVTCRQVTEVSGRSNGWKCTCGVTVEPVSQAWNVCSWKKEDDAACDGCRSVLIVGRRWKCTGCSDFDFCDACHLQFLAGVVLHQRGHVFKEVSASTKSCCNCALDVRGWTMSNYQEWSCAKCKARKASDIFSKLGLAHKHLGQFAIAVELLQERFDLVKEWGDKDGEMEVHAHLAMCFQAMGLFKKTTWHAQQQLRLAEERGNKRAEAVALQRLAESYKSQGKYTLAVELHEQVLGVARNLGGEDCVLKMRSNIRGQDWFNVARLEAYSTVSLREHAHKIFQATAHNNLGDGYYHVGKYSRAIEQHEQARAIVAGRAVDMREQAESVITQFRQSQRHGNTLRDQFSWAGLLGFKWGDVRAGLRARELTRQLNKMFLGDKYVEGEACAGLGKCYIKMGQYRQAFELHQHHLDIAQEAGDKAGQAFACHNLGTALQHLGDFVAAARILGRGLSLAQRVERDVGSHDERRISLFELQQNTYQQLQGVLLHLGKAQWALGVSGQAKARALSNRLNGANEGAADSRGHSDVTYEDMCQSWWAEVQQSASAQEATRIIEFSFLGNNQLAIWVVSGQGELLCSLTVPSTELSDTKGRSIAHLLAEARMNMKVQGRDTLTAPDIGAAQEEENMLFGISESPSDISSSKSCSPLAAAVLQPTPANNAHAFERQPAKCKVCGLRILQCTCASIEGERETNKTDLVQETEVLRELYAVLIAPVEEHIEDAEELLIVPHKELFEVPWAALIDAKGRYLIERHVIRISPSLRVAHQMAGKMPRESALDVSGHFLVVGNPLPTLPEFSTLPFAEKEAVRVEGILNESGLLVRDFFKADGNPRATKANVMKCLSGAKWAHFACHGDIDTDSLVLALPADTIEGTKEMTNLSMTEVQGVELARGSTIVLSACNTGRGEINGEGVVGLSRGFLLAGAASTVVSLWSVDDGSTAALMQSMYRHLVEGFSVAQALRLAMLSLALHPAPEELPARDTCQKPCDIISREENELGGFKRVKLCGTVHGSMRGNGVSYLLPSLTPFFEMLSGDAPAGAPRCAPLSSTTSASSGATCMHENEAERRAYWREFCLRNVAPTCVIDFPYDDTSGLNLSKEFPDDRLLERLYCFEDFEDETHLAVGGRRRRVILKVHTLLKWRDRGDKLFLRANKVTGVKVLYAHWNPQLKRYEHENLFLKLLPVSTHLQQKWRDAFRAGRYDEIEWCWREQGSLPSAEDTANPQVATMYDEVRAAIAMGESLFPRGAASTDKAVLGYHSGWKETYGVYQTNQMLRDGQLIEYEVFLRNDTAGRSTADGLRQEWQRAVHWAGFLVVGANTWLPRGPAS